MGSNQLAATDKLPVALRCLNAKTPSTCDAKPRGQNVETSDASSMAERTNCRSLHP